MSEYLEALKDIADEIDNARAHEGKLLEAREAIAVAYYLDGGSTTKLAEACGIKATAARAILQRAGLRGDKSGKRMVR